MSHKNAYWVLHWGWGEMLNQVLKQSPVAMTCTVSDARLVATKVVRELTFDCVDSLVKNKKFERKTDAV
jgi:hypothetical protein